MHTTTRWISFCALFSAAPLAAVACGDQTPPGNTPPQPSAEASASAAASAPAPEPSASAPAPEPSASAEAAASATAPTPDKSKSAGRPPVLLADPKKITDTFGFSPGAKLELGDKDIATLRIPEGALTQATNVTFEIDTKCKTTGIVTGRTYKITPVIPPSSTPAAVASNNGAPFVLWLPGIKKRDLNLAIGEYTKDAKGNETIKFKVLAPAKTDESTGVFEFHLDALPDGCVHLTSKPPT